MSSRTHYWLSHLWRSTLVLPYTKVRSVTVFVANLLVLLTILITSPLGGGVLWWYVRLFVCCSARISGKPHSWTSLIIVHVAYVAWFNPHLAALRYMMYFRFSGWPHVFISKAKTRGDSGGPSPQLLATYTPRQFPRLFSESTLGLRLNNDGHFNFDFDAVNY